MLLQVNDIHVHYGPIAAVRGISLEVDEADFVTIIGSNGAGKSTTLRTISGLNHPSAGTIVFDGQPIENLSADRIVELGIAHVPEGRRVFKDLTVTENLLLGAFTRKDHDVIEADLEQNFDRFPRLRERKDQIARILVGINKAGTSIILVEQNAELALRLARHGYVLETGGVALEGEADDLMDNPHVRKAYLGM